MIIILLLTFMIIIILLTLIIIIKLLTLMIIIIKLLTRLYQGTRWFSVKHQVQD